MALRDRGRAGGDGSSAGSWGSGSPPTVWECRLSLGSSWDWSWYLRDASGGGGGTRCGCRPAEGGGRGGGWRGGPEAGRGGGRGAGRGPGGEDRNGGDGASSPGPHEGLQGAPGDGGVGVGTSELRTDILVPESLELQGRGDPSCVPLWRTPRQPALPSTGREETTVRPCGRIGVPGTQAGVRLPDAHFFLLRPQEGALTLRVTRVPQWGAGRQVPPPPPSSPPWLGPGGGPQEPGWWWGAGSRLPEPLLGQRVPIPLAAVGEARRACGPL